MNRRTVLLTLALAGLCATLATAAGKPDFSGSWKLNSGKSDFGPMPAPEKLDRTIKHEDPKMSMTTVSSGPQGDSTTDATYTIDGKDSVNKQRGMDVKSVAIWEGDSIVIKSKRDFQGMEISLVENWSLSKDGKVLTIVNKASTPQGDFVLTTVLDKVDGAAVAATPAAAKASAKPDFSGDWKLNIDKSNFGPMPPPTSMSLKVDHKDPALKVITNQNGMDGESTTNATYSTDGKPGKNDFRGAETTSVAKWEGETLLIDTKLNFQGMDLTLKQSWKLSSDGKTITQATKIMTAQGDFDMASVLEKVAN